MKKLQTAASPPKKPGKAQVFHSIPALQELRDRSWRFLRLDLLYLVAAGGIFTALGFSRQELITYGALATIPLVVLVVIASLDVTAETLIASDLISAHNENRERVPARVISFLPFIQGFLHVTFIGTTLLFLSGYASGAKSVRNKIATRAEVQHLVDRFVDRYGRAPADARELRRANERYPVLHRFIAAETFSIAPDPDRKYVLTFAGDDGVLGTIDDDRYDGQTKARDLLKELESTDPTAR